MNLKKILKFLSTSAIIQVLNLILSFLAIKFLSLSDLGRYNIAKSIAGTFDFANLGYRFGLDRKLPETKNEELNKLRLSICFIINTIVSFLILFFIAYKYDFNWFYILYGCGGAFIASFTLIRVYLRGVNKIDLFIKASLFGGVIPIVFQILGLFFFGLPGLGISFLIASIIVYTYYRSGLKLFSIKEMFSHKKYIFLFFKVGNIIYLTNFFIFIANNFDRFFIEHKIGLEAVGEYGIIVLVFSLSLIIPGAVLEMLFPEYIRDKKNNQLIKNHIKNHIKISGILIFIFISVLYFLLPYVMPFAFEKYAYLVEPMQIILFALVPYIFINPIYSILFAFDKHRQILLANILSTIIYFTLLYLLLLEPYTILNLAYLKVTYAVLNLIFMLFFLILNRKQIFIK